jgi:hypothetical protein
MNLVLILKFFGTNYFSIDYLIKLSLCKFINDTKAYNEGNLYLDTSGAFFSKTLLNRKKLFPQHRIRDNACRSALS